MVVLGVGAFHARLVVAHRSVLVKTAFANDALAVAVRLQVRLARTRGKLFGQLVVRAVWTL